LGAGELAGIDFSNREEITSKVSDNGALTLAWQKDEARSVEIQRAGDAAFTEPQMVYRGTDAGTVVSGLAEGSHWFRIRLDGTSAWSTPLQVEVEFFPRKYLFLLLGTGGIVVIATLVTIIAGHFKSAQDGRLD